MSDKQSELFKAMARVGGERAHAEACGAAIRSRAAAWLPAAERAARGFLGADEAILLEPDYNEVGALNLARGVGILRNLRGVVDKEATVR